MNRTFLCGLVSAAVGAVAGVLVGFRDGGSSIAWPMFIDVFALVTVVLCLAGAAISIVRNGDDGIVGVGDALMAIGALVASVEAGVFAVQGSWSVLGYAALVMALAMFAVHQERQTAMAVACVMGLFGLSWVVSDPGSGVLGLAPSLMWVVAGVSYAMSLKVGEAV